LEGDNRTVPTTLSTIVGEAWKRGIAISGDFAREHAALIGMAASMQLITTWSGVYSHRWQVTTKGLRWLNAQEIK
jgi:hypothetical protein